MTKTKNTSHVKDPGRTDDGEGIEVQSEQPFFKLSTITVTTNTMEDTSYQWSIIRRNTSVKQSTSDSTTFIGYKLAFHREIFNISILEHDLKYCLEHVKT